MPCRHGHYTEFTFQRPFTHPLACALYALWMIVAVCARVLDGGGGFSVLMCCSTSSQKRDNPTFYFHFVSNSHKWMLNQYFSNNFSLKRCFRIRIKNWRISSKLFSQKKKKLWGKNGTLWTRIEMAQNTQRVMHPEIVKTNPWSMTESLKRWQQAQSANGWEECMGKDYRLLIFTQSIVHRENVLPSVGWQHVVGRTD